jgi:plastocyanin
LRRLTIALALCVPLAGGCGGDGGDSGGGRTVTVAAGAKVGVVAREYSFDPSGIEVRGPGRLTVTLRNEGSLAHNLKVFQGDRQVGGTSTFPAGKSGSAALELEPGAYRMICTVGDHAELGMTGELRVD